MSHTHSMEAVVALFRAAMNYRHDVLSAAQKQELEGWVRNSRVLKVIIEEKEKDKAARQGGSAAPEGQASGQQQQAASANGSKQQEPGAVQQVCGTYITAGPPVCIGHPEVPAFFIHAAADAIPGCTVLHAYLLSMATHVLQDAAGHAAESALEGAGDQVDQPAQGPAEAPPPPPAEPYPEAHSPLSEEGQTEQGQQPPLPGVVNLSSARQRSSSSASAFKMKIVVESTPADIHKQPPPQGVPSDMPASVQQPDAGAAAAGTSSRGEAAQEQQQQEANEQRSLQQQLAQAQAQAQVAAQQQQHHHQQNQQGSNSEPEPMSVDPVDRQQQAGRGLEHAGPSSKRTRSDEEGQYHPPRYGRSRSRSPDRDGAHDRCDEMR